MAPSLLNPNHKKSSLPGKTGSFEISPYRQGQPLKLMQLPEDQKAQLITWLFDEGLSYFKCLTRLKERFNVSSSLHGMSKFWHTVEAQKREAETLASLEIDLRVRQGGQITQVGSITISLAPLGNDGKATAQTIFKSQ